jgi:hypothetical protein
MWDKGCPSSLSGPGVSNPRVCATPAVYLFWIGRRPRDNSQDDEDKEDVWIGRRPRDNSQDDEDKEDDLR